MAIVTINTAQETALNWGAKGTDRKVQNVLNIMRTYQGEVAYNRPLGISSDIIDKPIDDVRAIIAADLANNIEQNVQGVNIVSIDVSEAPETGDFIFIVKIEV